MTATLADATVQDLQLELIRRTAFNDFDGRRVHADLVARRDLWLGAALGREDLVERAADGERHLAARFRLLTDLPSWDWNADTLWLLAPSLAAARELVRLARTRWRADRAVVFNRANSRRTTAVPPPARVVALTWH